jgi:hypothetical protein
MAVFLAVFLILLMVNMILTEIHSNGGIPDIFWQSSLALDKLAGWIQLHMNVDHPLQTQHVETNN